jgi:hypothetical protein
MNIKTYPYLVMNTSVTIEAIIRHYNTLDLPKNVLALLVEEFNRLNPSATPPRLGQRLDIPVLKLFWKRHDKA